jgi:hypothetical protein
MSSGTDQYKILLLLHIKTTPLRISGKPRTWIIHTGRTQVCCDGSWLLTAWQKTTQVGAPS